MVSNRDGKSRVLTIVALAAALILGAACGGSEPIVDGTSPPAASPTTPPTPSSTPSPVLEDGRHFGFIKSVDIQVSPHTLVFDKAQWFTGEEANQAAREDGVIGPDEVVPNDSYVRNVNPLLRTLPFGDGVEPSVIDWTNCCEPVTGEVEPFAAAFREKRPTGAYRGAQSAYWITVIGGEIVKIEEQYQP